MYDPMSLIASVKIIDPINGVFVYSYLLFKTPKQDPIPFTASAVLYLIVMTQATINNKTTLNLLVSALLNRKLNLL